MKTEPSTSSTTPPVLPKRGEPEINPPPFVRGNLAWGVHCGWMAHASSTTRVLSGWCFLQLLLVISSCHPGIIPKMGCLLRGVLQPQTYKVWRSVIATHSVMMCFWSSWWASQNLHDVMYMFPWYFAFWLAFTGIMLLLVILVLFSAQVSHVFWSPAIARGFSIFHSMPGLGHLVCFCWDFLCCHLFVHYV